MNGLMLLLILLFVVIVVNFYKSYLVLRDRVVKYESFKETFYVPSLKDIVGGYYDDSYSRIVRRFFESLFIRLRQRLPIRSSYNLKFMKY